MTDTAILAEDLRKTFDDVVAVDRISLAVPAGHRARPARRERRGQDHDGAHAHHGARAHQRARRGERLRRARTTRRPCAAASASPASTPRSTRTSPAARTSCWSAASTTWRKAERRQRAVELLDQFRLTDAADRPVRTYSGGMRRRLDLGAALVTHPPVLFLDEPTTGLDPASRLDLWEVIETLVADGTTVLLTTQYLEEADRLADNIVVIDQGRIAAEGTAEAAEGAPGRHRHRVRVPRSPPTAALAAASCSAPTPSAGTVVRQVMTDGAATLRDALNRLDAAGLAPAHVALREPTLDDVFLTLTGNADGTGEPALSTTQRPTDERHSLPPSPPTRASGSAGPSATPWR